MFLLKKINKERVLECIGVFVIIILVMPMIVLLLPSSTYKEKTLAFLRYRLPLVVNARVFTSSTDSFSILLGGTIKMTANKTDGSNEDIDTHFPNTFNSSHSKAKNNIIFGDFKKYEDKTNGVLSTKYKAFRQLFCTNIEYKNILVETILKQQNENHAEKKIISSINCQE